MWNLIKIIPNFIRHKFITRNDFPSKLKSNIRQQAALRRTFWYKQNIQCRYFTAGNLSLPSINISCLEMWISEQTMLTIQIKKLS